MRPPSAVLFLLRSYLVQGVAAGALSAVVMPTLVAGGMDLAQYSEQSALALLPWCIKLLWAPAIDRFTQAHPHRLVRWVAWCQLLTGLLVLLVLGLGDIENYRWGWGLLWLTINTGLAAQDTATDACAIRYIAPSRRPGANSAMQFGHALGASVFAGWFLGAIARSQGLSAVGIAVAGFLLAMGAYELIASRTWVERETTDPPATSSTGSSLAIRPYLIAGAIAASALLTQAITSTAAVPFLFTRLGWTPAQYQQELYPISTAVTLLAFGIGARLLSRRPALWSFTRASLALGALWILLGVVEPWWDPLGRPLIQGYAVLESCATALWTASLYTLLMGASQGRHRALAFATLMTLMNLSRLAGTLVAPPIVAHFSFDQLWILMGALQIAWTILCLWALRLRKATGKA